MFPSPFGESFRKLDITMRAKSREDFSQFPSPFGESFRKYLAADIDDPNFKSACFRPLSGNHLENYELMGIQEET